MVRDMRADRDKSGVESARLLLGQQIGHLVVQHDAHAHRLDARDFAHKVGARQPVSGNAEMQHAAGQRPRLVDLHGVAEPGQMIGGRQPAGARAHHQDALAAGWRLDRRHPVFARRQIAQESLHRVDADRRIQLASIARGLARVVADPPVHRGQRVVARQHVPGLAVLSSLRQIEPSLDVLARRTGMIAGRQQINIDGPPQADRTRAPHAGQIRERRHVVGLARHSLPSVLGRREFRPSSALHGASALAGQSIILAPTG